MPGFKKFANAVRKRFNEMAKEPLFEVAMDREEIWATYLSAFPEGSDPIYRKRSTHDCSCCRHFIYNVGNVVAIQNGAIASVWDLNGLDEPYQTVADKMSAWVKGREITDVYLTKMASHGQELSRAYIENAVVQFNHFHVTVPREFVAQDIATRQGDARTTHAVLVRGLNELKPEAISTVLDLMDQNALYRGAEYKRQVTAFFALQSRYLAIADENERKLFAWSKISEGPSITRLRNTAIGTLLQDLSADMELEEAVKKYERVVAPQNYKRPTALITKAAIEGAMKTIRELELETALERRHAHYSDVSVNSVLFVDNAVRSKMKDGTDALASLLMAEAKPAAFDPKGAQEVSAETFFSSILPKAKTIELLVANEHLGNFMSLTAPIHADAQPLFKWGNGFAWSYEGNVTDSIKERVKKAGGRVEGVAMRVSLAWFNYDDLDLHCYEPDGNHVFYGHKHDTRGRQQILDVDMNAGGGMGDRPGHSRQAVENLRWIGTPHDGEYRIVINNYAKMESIDVGFEIEIEGNGLSAITTLRYDKAVGNKNNVEVATITVTGGKISEVKPSKDMIGGSFSREQWGLKTLELARVNSIILSPNYWSEHGIGNKHWFFILEGCKNPLPVRGVYNEFLRQDLEKHRKVFEVLGEKTKCAFADEQMSGLGFSSTLQNKVTILADRRPYIVIFGGAS